MSSSRQSSSGSTLSSLRAPPRLLWTGLSLFSLLVLLYAVLVQGALLFGIMAVSFVVFWVGIGWLLYAYVEQRVIGVVTWPIAGTLFASVLILLYSPLIEGAVLLGVIAAGLFVAAGVVVGTLLTLDGCSAETSEVQTERRRERVAEPE